MMIMAVESLDKPAVKELIVMRGGMVEVIEKIIFCGVNYRLVFFEEDLHVPLVLNDFCLLECLFVIRPSVAVYKYCESTRGCRQ